MLPHGSGASREQIVPSSNWLFFSFFFLIFFFFSIFFFCCCCFSTCTIKLYHLQPEPATARPSCLWMVHTLQGLFGKIAIGRKIRRVGGTTPQRGWGQGSNPSSSLSLSLDKPSAGGPEARRRPGGRGRPGGATTQPQAPRQEWNKGWRPLSCPCLGNS